MFGRIDTDERQREIDDLQDRIQRLERERRESDEAAQEAREAQARQARYTDLHTADTWPEALRKQQVRCADEVALGFDNGTFAEYAAAAAHAEQIWPVALAKRQAEIDALRAQIDQIEIEVGSEVAAALEAANPHKSWGSTAQWIRNGSIHDFLDW